LLLSDSRRRGEQAQVVNVGTYEFAALWIYEKAFNLQNGNQDGAPDFRRTKKVIYLVIRSYSLLES
jgi:hypothetical protein